MIKKLLLLVAVPALLFSCKKESTPGCTLTDSAFVAPAAEVTALQNWVIANRPGATSHPSGLFYEIANPGSGTVTPGVCSTVTVKYAGYLTNGSKFDDSSPTYPNGIPFLLGQLILGWQKGIPLVKKGGSLSLYIPPSLGYGNQDVRNNAGVVVVPANSILIFSIQLVEVQ
jgi:FKBP-type peptidyl-prolyl cis-trans isomerase FkpA